MICSKCSIIKAKGYGNQLKLNVIVIVTTNKQIFGDGGQQFDI